MLPRDLHRSLAVFLLSFASMSAPVGCSSTTGTSEPPSPAPSSSTSATPVPDDETPKPQAPTAFTRAEVQALFDDRCVRCHDASNALLDLTSFEETTVRVATGSSAKKGKCASSAQRTRIVPGDREASLLWRKVKGSHDCGSPMPYERGSTPLDATELERLGLYIDGLK